MKNFSKKNQTGFTLIEILLYLSLSVIMVALIGGVGVNVLSLAMGVRGEEDLQYNAQFVTERIRTLVNEAESIELPLAGETASVLSLAMSDISRNPTIIDVVDGRVRMRAGDGESQLLTGTSVVVSEAEFSNVTYENSPGTIRVNLNMELFNPGDMRILRGSTTLSTTVNVQYP